MTLQTEIKFGKDTYTVAELLRNMRNADCKGSVAYWARPLYRALLVDNTPDIWRAITQIEKEWNLPETSMSEDDEHTSGDMPPVLVNYIFADIVNGKELDLRKLWHWIDGEFLWRLEYPYQYLALLLFLEHHKELLSVSKIENQAFESQMRTWFPNAKVKCSADAIGTYRNGFFKSDEFDYTRWLYSTTHGVDYDFKKDQTLTGFNALKQLCSAILEEDFKQDSFLK